MKYIVILFLVLFQSIFAKEVYFYQGGKKVILVPQNNISRGYSDVDYYLTSRGISLGVTDLMIVKFKNIENLNSYLSEFNLAVVKKISKNLYLFKSSSKSVTIDITNRLSEKQDVQYAQPDFIKKIIKR